MTIWAIVNRQIYPDLSII